MPCNVIVYRNKRKTFVSAVLPTSAMSMIGNKKLKAVAIAAEEKLKKVIDSM